MTKSRFLVLILAACLLTGAAGLLAGCSSDDGLPDDHTVDKSGVLHKDGFTNPLVNCVECHGADLSGGKAKSCYDCHNTADHQSIRGGVPHRSRVNGSCDLCHGPNNTGGLGPACTRCHTA